MATDKQILKIQELKILAEQAYEKYHEEVKKVFDVEGESVSCVEIEPIDGKNWVRLTLIDNAARLKAGETVVGISLVREVGAKIEYLVNKPKNMKV